MRKPFEPILLRDKATCDVCKEPTFWKTPLQKKFGRCLDHIPVVARPLVRAGERLAEDVVLAVFPEAALRAVAPAPRYARGEYPRWVWLVLSGHFIGSGERVWATGYGLPLDTGPCVRCRYLIRAYGPDARAMCSDCEEETK